MGNFGKWGEMVILWAKWTFINKSSVRNSSSSGLRFGLRMGGVGWMGLFMGIGGVGYVGIAVKVQVQLVVSGGVGVE